MSKMGSHRPFGHLKHKLWPKEGPGVKLVVWLLTTKSQESIRFPCVQVECDMSLKSSWWGLQLCFKSHLNPRSTHKFMGPQSCENPNFGNFETPTWESWDKSHLDVGPVGSHKVYYKGEGGGFPQVWCVVSLVSPSRPWLVLAPKVLPLCTNHLVLVLCRPVWVSEACQFFVVPSRSSSMPLYPSKVLQARERAQLLVFLLFSIWDSHLNPSRN
jgi:hypothetical protein